MTPAQLDLARKLTAHPRWRWVPGMLIGKPGPRGGMSHFKRIARERYDWEKDDGSSWDGGPVAWFYDDRPSAIGFLPINYVVGYPDLITDLTDPSTVGCLLAMLWLEWSEATLTPLLQGVRTVTGWVVYRMDDDGRRSSPTTHPQQTPGEAVAMALLRAWEE